MKKTLITAIFAITLLSISSSVIQACSIAPLSSVTVMSGIRRCKLISLQLGDGFERKPTDSLKEVVELYQDKNDKDNKCDWLDESYNNDGKLLMKIKDTLFTGNFMTTHYILGSSGSSLNLSEFVDKENATDCTCKQYSILSQDEGWAVVRKQDDCGIGAACEKILPKECKSLVSTITLESAYESNAGIFPRPKYGDIWGATAVLIACCCLVPILAIPLCIAFFYWYKAQFKKFQEKEAKR